VLWLGDVSFSPSATVFVSDSSFRSILVCTLLPLHLCYPLVFSVFLFRSRCLKTKMLMRGGWLTNVPLCFCFFLCSLVLVTGFLSVSMFFLFFSSLFSTLSTLSLSILFFFAFSFSLSSCSLSSVRFFFRLWPSLTFYKAKGWPLFMCSCPTIVRHERLCFFEKKQGAAEETFMGDVAQNGFGFLLNRSLVWR